jgi:amino acid transporter
MAGGNAAVACFRRHERRDFQFASHTKRTSASAQFRREEERVEQRSAVFPKELGLTNLVLTQVVFVVTFFSCGLVATIVAVSMLGLGFGKWIHNAGGVLLLLTFLALVALLLVNIVRGNYIEYRPFAFAVPAFSLFNLNIYSKLALGALTGIKYVAILAGESKSPARNIGRSVVIAAPVIAIMFILGTASVIAFVRPDEVDLISPEDEVLRQLYAEPDKYGQSSAFTLTRSMKI